ncbi:MAG: copper homeostasis protein CutC [Buchananella hordeovulneris]|nr:copper homeostasis protein CutC [Buchananella hordeovulneris]
MAIEIAVQDVAGTRVAAAAGADRVELCTALSMGGLTPSGPAISQCAEEEIPVHVLIRSRAGGFVYSPDEVLLMAREAAAAADAGASGVVIGALRPDSTLDLDAIALIADYARTAGNLCTITLHRCADVALAAGALTPAQLVETCAELEIGRILTSGGAAVTRDGLTVLSELAAAGAGTGVEIQAGGGVTVDDFTALAAAGVPSAHMSCRAERADAGSSGPGGGPASFSYTDPERVAAAVAAARAAGL